MADKQTIFIVEDEQNILKLVSLHLKKANFDIKEFSKAEDFLNSMREQLPSAVILDLMLPDADGLEICKYLKNSSEYRDIPVIILTAKSEETDRIVGLELGADDYISKPFSPRELVARVKTVLRRYQYPAKNNDTETIGKIMTINTNRHEVIVKGETINLTTTEFNILKILLSKKGWVFTRENLLTQLWQGEKAVIDRTIDVHVKNLRKKLGEAGKFIINVRGIGYKIEE